MPDTVGSQYGLDLAREFERFFKVVKHCYRRYNPGRPLLHGTVRRRREEGRNQSSVGRVILRELAARRVHADAADTRRAIRLQGGRIVASNVQDHITANKWNEALQLGDFLAEMTDH